MPANARKSEMFVSPSHAVESLASRKEKVTSKRLRRLALPACCAILFGALTSTALAFDPGTSNAKDPWKAFRFGFDAYKSGDKKEAVEAYRYAAENGHAGAQWKLAHMYASGDGVGRDEYQAFVIFEKIVQLGAEPGSPDESYVSDALVALAGYLQAGIPG